MGIAFAAANDRQYLPMDVLTAGVKTGRLYRGHFNASQYNYLEVS
jgi:exosome complex exonuclease DIS3/RRP44